jgi:hypothetical protein
VQPKLASPVAKLLPVIVTTVPTRTSVLGVKMIFGLTVNVTVGALSPPGVPVTFTVTGPAGTPEVPTTNEPLTTPPDTEHEGVP